MPDTLALDCVDSISCGLQVPPIHESTRALQRRLASSSLVLNAAAKASLACHFRLRQVALVFRRCYILAFLHDTAVILLPRRARMRMGSSVISDSVTIRKSGLNLNCDGSQFIVLKRKYSASKGNEPHTLFDQAARTFACMAESLSRCSAPIDQWKSLGFHVLAPRARSRLGVFRFEMTSESILKKINDRIGQYAGDDQESRRSWYKGWIEALISHLPFSCIPWESVLRSSRP